MGISRRKFIKISSAATSFLVVGCKLGSDKVLANVVRDLKGVELNQFISIGSDGTIILFNHRPEMGQGTFQAIPMIIAEELEVDIIKVHIKASEANSELYGSQMVVGSRSIQTEFEKLRIMGATARDMLRQAAANRWELSLEDCIAENGLVKNTKGDELKYEDLVLEAGKLEAPESPKLKPVSDFKIIGTPVARQDIPLKTNGEAKYGIDIVVPDMLHASIERSPVFLGSIVSYNESEVLKVPGVKHVFKTKRDVFGRKIEGVAVLAETYWAATQGRKVLKVVWDHKGLDKVDDSSLASDYLKESKKDGSDLFSTGNAKKELASASKVIEASYETPYQAHVPMEPMNGIVSIKENEAEFWGSTQHPNGIKSYLANTYQIPEENVKINYTFMGGGFGRRSLNDVAEEAADLSKQAGVPVKVIWTREDDQTQGPFRAASLNVCKATLDENGKISALEHKVVAQEIHKQAGNGGTAGRQLMGGINAYYLIPNYSVRGILQKRHIPIGYWRAVYHTTNPFAHESFIDELAIAAGKDPIQFRLEMLDHPRYVRVLKETLKLTDWTKPKPTGVGRGVALIERSGGIFTMVVEVMKKDNKVIPTKITTVLDLGICINPDTVKAQTEGSIIMALGAVYAGIRIKNGAVEQQNFNTYPLLRMDQTPEIITHILKSEDAPKGAGETGLPTVAPALVNAIFDLTGKRIRKLPFDPGNLG